MQDLLVRPSASRSRRDHLCKISVSGPLQQDAIPLVQKLFVGFSCIRILYRRCTTSYLYKNPFRITKALLLLYHAFPEIRKPNCTSIPRNGSARSPRGVVLGNLKKQLYQHAALWARTISAEGCASKSENATLPAFRALDTRDLRRRFHLDIKKHDFTSIPGDQHLPSPRKVALRKRARYARAPC